MVQALAFGTGGLWVITTCLLVAVSSIEPGCSFYKDQCVYSIQLGHQKQCDKIAGTGKDVNDTQRIDGLKSLVDQMSGRLDSLQKQMDLMKASSPSTCKDSSSHDGEKYRLLQEVTSLKQQLMSEKKAAANALSKEREEAAKKESYFRSIISNKTRSLSSCQKALGIQIDDGDDDDVDDLDTDNQIVLYCNFDSDECGFDIPNSGGVFGRQSTPFPRSGPKYDYTKGIVGGYVLGLDATKQSRLTFSSSPKSFLAKSPVLPATSSPLCLVFSYLMNGIDVQDLEALIYENGGTGYPLFKHHGRSSPHWKTVLVDLSSEYTSSPIQVAFRVTTKAYRQHVYSNSYKYYYTDGNIAVDNLIVYNSSCRAVIKPRSNAYRNDINGSTSYYTFHTESLNWSQAYDVCRKESPYGGLVSIQSSEEQQFLVDTINNDTTLSAVGQRGFYTSGSDHNKEGVFGWTHNGDPEVVPTGIWNAGQPNNVGGKQDCLLMEYAANGYLWGDVDCTTKHPFICESGTSLRG